jgi:hydroxypyruvate reductase
VVATGNPVDPPAVVLSGGETTVTVRGDGVGGPNLEYALSAAVELAGEGRDAVLASVDTDGKDGGTDVAGAVVDGTTLEERESRAAAREALARNDALPLLDAHGCVIRTGPTGTNVNDLRVLVVDRE